MANPFEKKRIPGIQREPAAIIAEEPQMEEPIEESKEELVEEPEELLNPAKVLYTVEKCETCKHFVAEGQPCRKVSGPISAGGVCILHEVNEAPMEVMEPMEPAV